MQVDCNTVYSWSWTAKFILSLILLLLMLLKFIFSTLTFFSAESFHQYQSPCKQPGRRGYRIVKMTGQEMDKDKITSCVTRLAYVSSKSSLKYILSSLCKKKKRLSYLLLSEKNCFPEAHIKITVVMIVLPILNVKAIKFFLH